MEEDRREKILLKAIELYMIEGYANVSITDLQEALNMGRGTMYYYFKDKDELFQEAIQAVEKASMADEGDVIVLTAGVPIGTSGTTNLLKVHCIES